MYRTTRRLSFPSCESHFATACDSNGDDVPVRIGIVAESVVGGGGVEILFLSAFRYMKERHFSCIRTSDNWNGITGERN